MTEQEIKRLLILLSRRAFRAEVNGEIYPDLWVLDGDLDKPLHLYRDEPVLAAMKYEEDHIWLDTERSWTLNDLRGATVEGDTLLIKGDVVRFFEATPIQLEEPTLEP